MKRNLFPFPKLCCGLYSRLRIAWRHLKARLAYNSHLGVCSSTVPFPIPNWFLVTIIYCFFLFFIFSLLLLCCCCDIALLRTASSAKIMFCHFIGTSCFRRPWCHFHCCYDFQRFLLLCSKRNYRQTAAARRRKRWAVYIFLLFRKSSGF